MQLSEHGRISIDKTLGDYLSITKGTDKDTIRLRDLLLHQAGLKAWIPFYKSLLDSEDQPIDSFFNTVCTDSFCIPVAKNLYLRADYVDTVWQVILNSPLENRGRYVYSDLDYYFLAAVVEKVSGQPLNRYVAEHFYKPMGLRHIGYLPLSFALATDIAPTEDDEIFRHQILRGYVHDQGAALFGGVAGHAGVFATAQDVAAIFQMLLAGGTWHGRRYFKPETIRYFTAYHSAISRRALGFDKPTPEPDDGGPAGNRCSGYAFGHQGFTGTCAWADPGTGIVYVFLSNRVSPYAGNTLINRLNVRTEVQDALYEALGFPVDTTRAALRQQQLGPQ
jgi:CubicO group peptidase (beta-lactamase class C family)